MKVLLKQEDVSKDITKQVVGTFGIDFNLNKKDETVFVVVDKKTRLKVGDILYFKEDKDSVSYVEGVVSTVMKHPTMLGNLKCTLLTTIRSTDFGR